MTNTENLHECFLKECEIAQDIISRMASNSFLIKGWAITLVVASLLIQGVSYHHYVAFLPWIIFWIYDAYFLRMERLYRKLYGWLIKNRASNNDEFLLDMSKDSLEKRFGKEVPHTVRVMFFKTLIAFYGLLLIIIVVSIYVDLSAIQFK
ncbi:MAG TPA: hypothetical protein VJ249_03805 [Candidatus Bathyarchaeia archaeon]|nr:hypothetical protein [Candidatus Bathyarchaeia archaeon]